MNGWVLNLFTLIKHFFLILLNQTYVSFPHSSASSGLNEGISVTFVSHN